MSADTNHPTSASSTTNFPVNLRDMCTQPAFREDAVTDNPVTEYVISVDPPLPLPIAETNNPIPSTNLPSPSVNRFIIVLNLRWPMANLRPRWTPGAFGEDGATFSTTNLPSVSHLVSSPYLRTQGAFQEDGVTMPESALSTVTDNPVVEYVISIDPPLPLTVAETNHPTFTTTNLPSPSVNRLLVILNLAERRPMASLRRLWTQGAFGGDVGVITPGSTFSFVIAGLYNFVEIKAQGQTGFPFTTHPQAIMFAVTSLIFYGLISAAEYILPTTRYGAIIACLGKMVCLFVLVTSMASLFYLRY